MLSDATSDIATLFAQLRVSAAHTLRPGASAAELDATAAGLGTPLPQAYRELLAGSDGLSLCQGLVTLWSTRELIAENSGIRFQGWFDGRHIFIGESAEPDEFERLNKTHFWGPDLFFVDTTEGEDPAVQIFQFTPTKVGRAAGNVRRWIELVVENEGFGAPGDFPWR